MCYLRKSLLKYILTLFIQWSFNFIGKMVLRVVRMLTNVHSTWDYTTFWIRVSCYCNIFFHFFLRNNPFGFITWPFVSLGHCTCLWLRWSHSGLGLSVDTASTGERAAARRSRQCNRPPGYFHPKSCFPKVMGFSLIIKMCLPLIYSLHAVHRHHSVELILFLGTFYWCVIV